MPSKALISEYVNCYRLFRFVWKNRLAVVATSLEISSMFSLLLFLCFWVVRYDLKQVIFEKFLNIRCVNSELKYMYGVHTMTMYICYLSLSEFYQ